MQESETPLTEQEQKTNPSEIDAGVVHVNYASSTLLAAYRSVTPRKDLEDAQKLREEFEKRVAEELIAETL